MYEVTPDIKAKITLLGRESMYSGYRPAHKIKLERGDYLTTGLQQYIGTDILNRNETVEGYITFISPEAYPHTIKIGMIIPFYEGSKLTGKAEVLEIYNEILK
ncbi:MAG: hypothetical protein IJ379_12415 [Lachnospiraceae bacterium]|nr:hypothetical protein [Lachnospiraceae bacterium]